MTVRLWTLIGVVAMVATASTAVGEPRLGATAVDAVYTEEQARQGERSFGQHCGRCHDTARFKGEAFIETWRGPLKLLFDRMQETMPEDNPGSLRPQIYADVIAYFLSLNGYPAGSQPLAGTADALQSVQIERNR